MATEAEVKPADVLANESTGRSRRLTLMVIDETSTQTFQFVLALMRLGWFSIYAGFTTSRQIDPAINMPQLQTA